VIAQEKNLFDKFIKLSEEGVTQKSIAKVVKAVTEVDINLDKNRAEEIYSTYQLNRTQELLTSISSEMQSKGQTLWGLFSGATHYTSHVMPVGKRDNARLESKYVGSGLKIDNAVLEVITNEIGLN
jgi:GH35 family endo-1,4-beta-xylanase